MLDLPEKGTDTFAFFESVTKKTMFHDIDAQGHIKLTDFGLCTGFRWTHNSEYYHNKNGGKLDRLSQTERNIVCIN